MGGKQVTPSTTPKLVKLLRRMSKRGVVRIEAYGALFTGQDHSGTLTCQIKDHSGDVSVVQCQLNAGVNIPIPITVKDFQPAKDGEAVAFYTQDGSTLIVHYVMHKRGEIVEGGRRFVNI